MKKIKKTLCLIVFALISISLAFIGIINYSAYFDHSNPVDLIEIKSSAIDLENRTITCISEDDFQKYPELGELFHNVTPIGDENFGDHETKFANLITVSERKASEIRKEHSRKTFYWKGGYYGILVRQP